MSKRHDDNRAVVPGPDGQVADRSASGGRSQSGRPDADVIAHADSSVPNASSPNGPGEPGSLPAPALGATTDGPLPKPIETVEYGSADSSPTTASADS